ncbi:aspartyl/asparaginyl beta-hydroxylase domain-containing protein [Burkholderia contaminans]|uniref:aspartyl/asparaginyl beta-hydroxylase domain-containing protein n=1 Tax=Burkholderia contaminans TaxID=488447 RepID=UPI0024165C8F|nr:aspartyl/asparaginyl beta-hydroxylase domain-containing protein [Burkholderia contaminans]
MRSPLSRATIVRLKPRSEVGVHIDIGSYYVIRNRFHLVLRSPSGSVLRAGDEQVRMSEGELWWFDNKQHHSAFNESDEWRIHYIFDVLQPVYASLAVNPVSRDHLPAEFVQSALTR